MKVKYSVSIITPVFNEEDIIANTLIKNIELLRSKNIDYEIIVVEDGSTDNSLRILRNLAKKYPFKIVCHNENKGLGAAIKSGVKHAKNDYLLCIPTDNPLNNELFSSFEENFGKADLLISYRRKRIGYTRLMNINSVVYHYIISKVFKLKLKDYNWIHAYHQRVFSEEKVDIEYNSIFMLAEVIIKARKNQYTFIEFPVNQQLRTTGTPSAAKLSTATKALIDILDYYFRKQ